MTNSQDRYPWDKWLNGETWELLETRDYGSTAESFRAAAWRAAHKRGVKVKTRLLRDADSEGIAIRAYREGEEFDWEEADRPGHHLLYPWEQWLDGKVWELRRGQHYEVPSERLRRTAWVMALRKGKKVRTRLLRDEDGEGIAIRAYEEGEEFDWEEANRPGPDPLYPWHEWLDGGTWELRKGRDYHTPTERFRRTAWYAANSQGMKIETRLFRDENGEGLRIRAHKP